MTKEQAEEKAARRTAAGVPSVPYAMGGGEYRTLSVAKLRQNQRKEAAARSADGRMQALTAARVASGGAARASKALYDRRKAYELELFAEAPDKRVALPDARRIVVLSDIQIPFEDGPALDQALAVLHRVRPDTVILNGDIVDCYAESDFLKDSMKAQETIVQTHERVAALLSAIEDVPTKVWMGGNHEDRWRRLLWGGSPNALAILKEHERVTGREVKLTEHVESFRRLYRMDDFGVAYYPYSHRLYLADGNLVVTHGKYVSRHSGYSAKRTWEWLGKSCIVGHTHRLGSYLITQDGKPAGAWENGCLCQLEPEYDDAPNWQQGFSIVQVDGPEFHVIQVPIIRRAGKPVAVYHEEA